MPPIGSLLLALALLVIVGLFILRPLLWAPAATLAAARPAADERETLEVEKEAILEQIRVLDFDHETGTVSQADYEQIRQELVAAAAAVLRELDALEPARAAAAGPDDFDEIEAAVAQHRRERAAADIEAAVAQRRARSQPVAVAGNGGSPAGSRAFCPQCGQAAEEGDRFCAYCGHQLD
jgi:hypothetical protein